MLNGDQINVYIIKIIVTINSIKLCFTRSNLEKFHCEWNYFICLITIAINQITAEIAGEYIYSNSESEVFL